MASRNPIFQKIAAAKVGLGGNWIKHGIYTLEILKVFIKPDAFSGIIFIVEALVVEAAAAEVGHEPNKVGSQIGYVCCLDKAKQEQIQMGNCKAFVCGLYDEDSQAEMSLQDQLDFSSIIEELCNQDPVATREDGVVMSVNPARGMRIKCETICKGTREDKTAKMVYPRWKGCGEIVNSRAETARRRAALDSGATPAIAA